MEATVRFFFFPAGDTQRDCCSFTSKGAKWMVQASGIKPELTRQIVPFVYPGSTMGSGMPCSVTAP